MTHPRLSELKAGDIISYSGSMRCLAPRNYKVFEDMDGCLYIHCEEDRHYLDSDLPFPLWDDADDTLANFTPVSAG